MNIPELLQEASSGSLSEWADPFRKSRQLTPVGILRRDGSVLLNETATVYATAADYLAAMDDEYPGLPGVLIVHPATE